MKPLLGEIIKFSSGAVQLCKINNYEYIIVTGRGGDIYIPTKVINKALEDSWRFERTSRGT